MSGEVCRVVSSGRDWAAGTDEAELAVASTLTLR